MPVVEALQQICLSIVQINELETGLLNLLKMISAGRLEEIIYLAGISVEQAEKEYLAKHKSNKNNAFEKKYFKYINDDYEIGKDIWRTESSELTAAKGGLRNITKNVPISAALTHTVCDAGKNIKKRNKVYQRRCSCRA